MHDSKSDDDIPVVVAAAAAVFTANPPLENTIEYEEEIPKLLFVDMQQEDEEKVAAALLQLAELLDTSKENTNRNENAKQAHSLGAIAITLLLMRKWHNNRSIQLYGCKVLGRLAYTNLDYYDTIDRARASNAAISIIKSGGIETIMAAMMSFPDDDDIQCSGCIAIGNAFEFSDPIIEKSTDRFVHKLNGIKLVVRVMKKFQNNASVQKQGCFVLAQLSDRKVLRDALKKGGALTAVSEATEKHDDKDVQSWATAFFKCMF